MKKLTLTLLAVAFSCGMVNAQDSAPAPCVKKCCVQESECPKKKCCPKKAECPKEKCYPKKAECPKEKCCPKKACCPKKG